MQNKNLFGLLIGAIIFSTFFSVTANAYVKIFREGKEPLLINSDLVLNNKTFQASTQKINKALAGQYVRSYIQKHQKIFGILSVSADNLQTRSVKKSRRGYTFRFIQRHNRVRIDGAEIIANFDRSGKLKALNSSLLGISNFNVQPEITKEQALFVIINNLEFKDDLIIGNDHGDGLKIITETGKNPVLVWQYSLMGTNNTGFGAIQIQVIARGKSKGRIKRIINISTAAKKGSIKIYDASITIVIPNPVYKGVKVLDNGKKSALIPEKMVSNTAKNANKNFTLVRDFYGENFNHWSFDGEGADIKVSVDVQRKGFWDVSGLRENAAWIPPWKFFALGAGGNNLDGFEEALDIVGHEYTHAVISESSNLEYVYQSGALNEHFADLFGAIIEQSYLQQKYPFLIGDTILRGMLRLKAPAIRDMLNPEKGIEQQVSHTSDVPFEFGSDCRPAPDNDNCGVHFLNSIPNRASALIINALGWKNIRNLFFEVMTHRMRSKSDFHDYRYQLLDECEETMSENSCASIAYAFDTVGIKQ